MNLDFEIRLAAFQWLKEQVDIRGDVLPRTLLQEGFHFQDLRIPLVSPQGIFKPRKMDFPLTITTTPNSPYADEYSTGRFLTYRYRGTDPMHPDNVGLRDMMGNQKPLIYFFGLVPGKYLPMWPVFIVQDDPINLSFKVAIEDQVTYESKPQTAQTISEEMIGRRAYITSITKVRLHQHGFREKVLAAYRSQCAFCKLRHRELLDAAHIIPDHEPHSRSSIDNGLSLCKLHHAAFDSFILGVSPDFKIYVRKDVMEEEDGPTLRYGLQELNGSMLILPRKKADWPNQDALDWKYQRFIQGI